MQLKKFGRKAWLLAVSAGMASSLMLGGNAYAGYDETGPDLDDPSAEAPRVRADHARLLLATLSEEKTEILALASQQAALKKMGGAQNERIAAMLGRWIVEHKAGGVNLESLIRQHGRNPEEARILKSPKIGTTTEMLHATMMDHVAALTSSQMRFRATSDWAIQWAMHKRGQLARKHMSEMEPYHNPKNCPACAKMMKM